MNRSPLQLSNNRTKLRPKKTFYLFLLMLLCSVGVMKAQVPPNPMEDTDIIPAGVAKTSIYGTSGKRTGFAFSRESNKVSDVGTQPSVMIEDDYGCTFKSTSGAWKTLRLTFAEFKYDEQKYIYFVSKGANKYLTVNGTNVTGYIASFNLSDGWTLNVVDLSKTTVTGATPITYLQWQTKEEGVEAYVANICFAAEPYIPPGHPREFQEPEHTALYSIYSDTDGSMITGTPTTWAAFSGKVSEYTDPISARKAYKVESTAGQSIGSSGIRFSLSSDNQKTIAELTQTYNKIRFDVWSPDATVDNYLRFYLYDTAGIGPVYLKAITADETNSWKTYEIDLVDLYGNSTDMTLKGIQFTNGTVTTGTTIFIDNIYLYKYVPPGAPGTPAPIPPARVAGSYTSVYSDADNYETIGAWTSGSTGTSTSVGSDYQIEEGDWIWNTTLTNTDATKAAYSIFTIDTDKRINAIEKKYNYLHFDVWLDTPLPAGIGSKMQVQLYSPASGYSYFYTAIPTSASSTDGDEWYQFDVRLSTLIKAYGDFTLEDVLNNISSLRVSLNQFAGEVTLNVDNIYFYEKIIYAPNIAPENAVHESSSVIPIYGQYSTGGSLNSTVNAWSNSQKYEYTDEDDNSAQESMKFTSLPSVVTMNSGTSLTTSAGDLANVFHFDVWIDPSVSNPELAISVNGRDAVSIPSALLNPSGWTSIEMPASRLLGSSYSNINSIQFTGSGTIYVDNVYFYFGKINSGPVAELNEVQYYSIKEAVDAAKNQTGDLEIAVIDNSVEPNIIYIDSKENVKWTSLTIYPKGNTGDKWTVQHVGSDKESWRSLFVFDNGAANVTIDGRLNKNGDSQSLILQGDRLGDTPLVTGGSERKFNCTINVRYAENVTIRDCKFQGKNETTRPVRAIQSNANTIKIIDNYFENCLFPGRPAENDRGDASVISIDGRTKPSESANEVTVTGNHFYETADFNCTDTINYRSFIKVAISPKDKTTPVRITDNKIGGKAANLGGGIMTIGHGTGAVQGTLYGIEVTCSHPGSAITVDETSAYALIYNNEIANININNNGSGLYESNGTFIESQIGSFNGITTTDGLCLVKENKIHDIELKSKAADISGSQRYLSTGIYSVIYGGKCRVIIEDNDIYNFNVDFTEDAPNSSVIIAGIFAQISNSSGETSTAGTSTAGTIRNNRILFGHTGTKTMSSYADISAISGRLSTLKYPAHSNQQLDIYNNVIGFNEFKLTASALRASAAINLVNSSGADNGVINCYNNISYIQAKGTDSFSGVTTPLTGIYHAINDSEGVVNVFHNTVFITKDAKLEANGNSSAGLVHDYRAGKDGTHQKGTLNVWNNNFVNLNDNGLIYYIVAPDYRLKTAYFDYNNYYVPAGGYMLGALSKINSYPEMTNIKTFDNWKFSNPISYLGKEVEHDHHSRFLYPEFNSTATPSAWTNISMSSITGLDNLKTNLAPKRFIGGKRTDVVSLGLKTLATKVDSDTNIATITSSNMDADSNMDINKVKRREYLPTMGVANTTFGNYWKGGNGIPANRTKWTNVSNWGEGKIPGVDTGYNDVVFQEGTSYQIILDSDYTVHDIYSDVVQSINLNGKKLTVTGYIGLESVAANKLLANASGSEIIYAGNDGHTVNETYKGAAAQHIFENIFTNKAIDNITLDNKSQYFVLLHGAKPWKDEEPTGITLNVLNDFTIINQNETSITYPNETKASKLHLGGLMCTWYNTNLGFTNSTSETKLPITSWDESKPQTYRPYAGQRIPRHGIYNNEVYDLTSSSSRLVSYHDFLYVNRNLTINSGGNLEIAADKYVQAKGTVSNSAGTAGLVIKSREVGTTETGMDTKKYLFPINPRPNATFVYNIANNNNNIDATVEMFSKAEKTTAWATTNGSNNVYEYRWQYFAPAVTGQTAALSMSGSTIYQFDPTAKNNYAGGGTGSPYWKAPGSTFTPGSEGYCIYYPSNKVYQWKGTLTNAPISKTLAYYKWTPNPAVWLDQEANDGHNLLSNPYTAGLDIKQITFGSNIQNSVYIYNTGSNGDWNENSGENAPGRSIVIPQNNAGKDGLPQYIPSQQAFTVILNKDATTNNTISFDYTAISKEVELQRAPSQVVDSELKLSVELRQEGYFDKVLLFTQPDCAKGFNNGWDGRTFPNPSYPLSIFTIEEEEGVELEDSYYQVSTMDDIDNTYFGIMVGNLRSANSEEAESEELVEYELVFNHEIEDEKLYLEDILLNDTIDISLPGSVYQFIEPNTGTIQKRFRIFFIENEPEEPNEIITPEEDSVKIYSAKKSFWIENNGSEGTVELYDTIGKLIQKEKVAAQTRTNFETNLPAGVYIIRFISNNKIINQRVILK
ncbi:T9SS type A sorting domain-containing protein [Bacteroidales bacterium OttesenSCG-928-M11]|nr:T9SS type A sorting domain-containing protein [Bacteroidales bacterium OttesenSCG-928-M11]